MSVTKPSPPLLPARTQERMTTSSCLPWKESTVSMNTCTQTQTNIEYKQT